MATLGLSTIGQLLFADRTTLDFARIVSELDGVLSRLRDGDVTIIWDCDDLVTFDIPGTRIVLAWTEVGNHRLGGCLTVSVGPGPDAQSEPERTEHDVLCSRLVERIQAKFDPAGVLWCQVEGAVDSDVVDAMMDALPGLANGLPPVESILEGLSKADLHKATEAPSKRRAKPLPQLEIRPTTAPAARSAPIEKPAPIAKGTAMAKAARVREPKGAHTPLVAANDQPDLPLALNTELARLRTALYPPIEVILDAPYSTQMRLAAHCMNATLILVWAPLGAAVMTYSLLKGEDMRLSARLMAVSGTLFALSQSPVGQTMAALAKGIV